MLRNYFRIALRNLLRNRTFSIINIAGLAIGLACFLLITLYVLDELSYDRYYDKADNIFRINMDAHWGGQDIRMAETSDVMGAALKRDYPQVEDYTRIYSQNGETRLIRKENEYITENHLAWVDSTFFNVFKFTSLQGNAATALTEPYTAVISATAAKKYFGETNVVGKILKVKDGEKDIPYIVNAVIEDIPQNTHFHFNILFSMKSLNYSWGQVGNMNFHTYLVLKHGTDYKAFDGQLSQYVLKYFIPALKEFKINSLQEFEKAGNRIKFSLVPVTKIHLYSNRQGGEELSPSGSVQYVAIFSVVALFILVIGCINFMNLTTARSAGRAREVGIRKVLGTKRNALIAQFLTESVLMVVLSFIIAIFIAYLALPFFNAIAGKSMSLLSLLSPVILPFLIALPFLVGLLAGSYPSLFLSAFKPIEVLKGKLSLGARSGALRSSLVAFQFTTSIVLIIATIVVYRQLHYIQNQDLGFRKEQVLIINGANALGNEADVFKKEVLQLSGVRSGTLSSFLPVSSSERNGFNVFKNPTASASNSFNVQYWTIDTGYLETIGIKLLKGRNFSTDFGMDSSAMIINEKTAGILGYQNPIGKNIYSIDDFGKATAHPIVGLVKNFNFESLHQSVGPLIFVMQKSNGLASFKINTGNVTALIEQIKNKWNTMAHGMPFSYRFLDESFTEMYQAEKQVGVIAMIFSVLAILISCLGILGLAIFVAEQRTKEIGIRKVLGAGMQEIVSLLSADFMKIVVIAFVIASPIAWWIMHMWLMDFVYRITISWWIFAVAGLLAIFIALFTVSFQAINAAIASPIKALRTD